MAPVAPQRWFPHRDVLSHGKLGAVRWAKPS
jgi:hypothetical protein